MKLWGEIITGNYEEKLSQEIISYPVSSFYQILPKFYHKIVSNSNIFVYYEKVDFM